jgi:hypothetical protein
MNERPKASEKNLSMIPDMSPEAVTARLRAVEELRRLCLALGKAMPREKPEKRHPSHNSPPASNWKWIAK